MTFASFLLQANLCLLVFYVFYRLFLHKETFFMWNRIYLITALCFSFIVPVLRFECLTKQEVTQELQLKIVDVLVKGSAQPKVNIDWLQWASWLYVFGVLMAGFVLLYKLWSLKIRMQSPQPGNAFSFFSFKRVDPNLADFETINRHEEVHIQQYHSVDILLMEIAGVIVWFNPVIYFYKLSIKNIHEYLADEVAAAFEGSKKQYALLLLRKAMGLTPDLTNAFIRESAVKKRILMLQRERSAKQSLWKYLWLIPLLSALLFLSSAIKGAKKIKPDGQTEQKMHNYGAAFPGGLSKFLDYLAAETKYPDVNSKNKQEGRVMVSFIIDTDGAVTNASIEEGLSPVFDKEALRVIRNSPNWIPGKENGSPVRVKYSIGLNFKPKT